MVEPEDDLKKPNPGKKKTGESIGSGSIVIDTNDPLYLHSNDTNGTPLISLKLTGTKNYRVWAAALKHCIHSKNKLGFINGKLPKPDLETDPFLPKQWETCNSIVLTWILNCASPELFIGQVFSSNAKHMWDELSKTYDKIDGFVIFNLHYKINNISQNGSKLSDYYHKLNSLWREYDAMVQLPVCTCDGASDYKDHAQLLKLMQSVMGLDDVYAPIRSTILTTKPLPTVKEAFSLLSRDESHRTMHAGGSGVKGSTSAFNSKPYDNKGRNTSFVPRSGDNKKRFNNSNAKNPNLNVVSNGPVNDKDTATGVGTSHTFTSEQYHRLMSLLSDSGSESGVQNNVAGSPAKPSYVFTFLSSRFFNKHRNISTYSAFVGWIIDSRATKVNQMGSCKITDKIVLHDVLVVLRILFSSPSLGHPADQVLSILKSKIDLKDFKSFEPCEVCHRAKQTRDPFPLSEHKTSFLRGLVNLDVWGPYKSGLDNTEKIGSIIVEGGADDGDAALIDDKYIYLRVKA
ncbi:putative transcription factor interactor and regulator CCHC(Zn) family protein [Tanacetum coccineum]